jgi:hypothetical protein
MPDKHAGRRKIVRDTSDIEVRALRSFERDLPDTCIANVEAQDKQHLDFTLHLREAGRPSGIQFTAQVKGIARSRGSRRVSKQFKREHLEYWIERSRLPVFIILVDVNREDAYYIFARDWARSYGNRWKEQNTTTVHVARTNRVSNHARFIQAIRDADLEMQRSAGRHAIAAYTARDDRFTYELTHRASGECLVTIGARQPVDVHVTVTGDAAVARFQQMLRTGQSEKFQPGELQFDGGPLFEYIQAEAHGKPIDLRMIAERDCHVAVLVEDEAGSRSRAIDRLCGTMQSGLGLDRIEFKTCLRDGILRLHGFLERNKERAGFRGRLNVSLDLAPWVGHRLPELPAIERIYQFAQKLANAKRSYIHFTVDGVPIEPPTELDPELTLTLATYITRMLEFYLALCDAATKLGVTPKLPDLDMLSDEAIEQIAALLELCKTGELVALLKPMKAEVDFALLEGVELPELREGRILITQRTRAELFGSPSEHYLLIRHLPFVLADDEDPVQQDGRVYLKLKTADEAQVVYRLQTLEEAMRSVTLP